MNIIATCSLLGKPKILKSIAVKYKNKHITNEFEEMNCAGETNQKMIWSPDGVFVQSQCVFEFSFKGAKNVSDRNVNLSCSISIYLWFY